jgi:hypothetical protein
MLSSFNGVTCKQPFHGNWNRRELFFPICWKKAKYSPLEFQSLFPEQLYQRVTIWNFFVSNKHVLEQFLQRHFLEPMKNLLEPLSAKLLRLLVGDNLGVAPDLTFCFGRDFETDMWCFLRGKLIRTTIVLVAYVVIKTWMSSKEEKSFNIYRNTKFISTHPKLHV